MDDKDQIVIDVEASHLLSMQRKLDILWGNPHEAENFTIFRTPHNICQKKKYLFEPSVISIGPFHRGQKSLQAMEEQKWRFLRDFLYRGDHISLDLCMSEMKLLEKKTRRCYSETVDLDSNVFVEMMLLDGCFVLEYFLKRCKGNWNSILEVGWSSGFITNDLLLLENQIPFFIVEKLLDIIGLEQEVKLNFVNFIVSRLAAQGPTNNSIFPNPPDEIHHLVHVCYHTLVPNPGKPVVLISKSFHLTRLLSPNRIKDLLFGFLSWVLKRIFPHSTTRSLSMALPNSTRNLSSMVIPCATELQDAGLKFRPKSNPQHILNISFDHGILEIPRLSITNDTKPLFANLIAYEQSKLGEMSHFASFAVFLDDLVNTQKDVSILQQCGIIENRLSCEEELTDFINQLNENVGIDRDHYLKELITEVNIYIESRWNRHRAKLIRDYFSSPWAAISLVAAFILLVLTFVQTFFAAFAYFVSPSS